jgi:hypothetical protein
LSVPWCWTAGTLTDHTAFHALEAGWPGATFQTGYVTNGDDLIGLDKVAVATVVGPEGLPEAATIDAGELTVTATARHQAPVLIKGADGRTAHLPRALCRFTAADGRRGAGWTEWLQPG